MTKCIPSWLVGLCLFFSPMLLNAQCVSTTVSSPNGPNPIVTCEGDGNPDLVSFSNSGAAGSSYAYAITDSDFNILQIVTDDSFDFEGAGIGDCQVWGFSYDGDITGMAGDFVFTTQFATNCWHISQNAIQVSRTTVQAGSISLADGSTEGFACVGDGFPDVLSFVSSGSGSIAYVVTDSDGTIISINNASNINFDDNSQGDFLVYAVSYSGNITAMIGGNINDTFSDDCFQVSENFVPVSSSTVDAGTISTDDGLSYVQIVDTTDAQIFNLINTSTSTANYAYLLTDNTFNILQILPGNTVDVNNLDAGKYFVWAYSYTGDIIAQMGESVFAYPFSTGCSQISITAVVIEKQIDGPGGGTPTCTADAGTLTIDANPVSLVDGVATVSATPNGDAVVPVGYETIFVLTNGGVIMQTGTTPSFDVMTAGEFTIHTLIAETSDNADPDFLDLSGVVLGTTTVAEVLPAINAVCADLDVNGVPVTVTDDMNPCIDFNGGMVMMPSGNTVRYTCPGDGNADVVMLDSTGVTGDNFTYIVTDGMGLVLGIPMGDMVDVEGAGEGNCRIYGLAYSGNLTVEVGDDINSDLSDDCFDLSDNFVLTIREIPNGGSLTTANGETEITLCAAGDGTADVIDFTAVDTVGQNFTYVVTDSEGMVLGIPTGNSVDFDPAGVGTCYVYGLSYTGDLNLEVGDIIDPLSNDPNANGGNLAPVFNEQYDGASAIYISNDEDNPQFFVSSNTQNQISAFGINGDDTFNTSNFESEGMDADGIYYDADADVIYQLNRTDNVINAYSDVSSTPMLTATSTSDFTNGREIAVSGDMLVVAQDANAGNGDQNRLLVYQITPTAITLMNEYDVDINLWGIHADGTTLYAVVDNSSDVAVFENFFGQADGMITPTNTITVDDIIRTHGLTYDADEDLMILTDVGSGMVDDDGAFVVVYNFMDAIADGTVSADEQVRVAGADTFLGNPVDVALDLENDRVYIAERANGGGRILSFELPNQNDGTGSNTDVASDCFDFSDEFVTVNRFNIDAGMVTLSDGQNDTTVVIDGSADILTFVSTGANGDNFTFAVTDTNGVILSIPTNDTIDFELAGPGVCYVWGIAYTGNLTAMVGDTAALVQLSDGCAALTELFVTVTRNELDPCVELNLDGGVVTLTGGATDTTIIIDGNPNILTFETDVDTMGQIFDFTFLVTDSDGNILGIPMTDSVDFNPAGLGVCYVYGLTYTGNITAVVGDNINDVDLTDDCSDLSDMFVTVTRNEDDEPCLADAGTLTIDVNPVSLVDGVATVSATPNGDAVVPMNFETIFALTSGGVILQFGFNPSFDVTTTGDFIIHTLIAEITDNTDPNFLDPSVIVLDSTTVEDVLPAIQAVCASLDLDGAPVTVNDDMPPMNETEAQFFVSSNTQDQAGVFSILDNGMITLDTFTTVGLDSDGIYYDTAEDVVYQLNRTANVINAYSNVNANLDMGIAPDVTATSTSDFSNGREIAVSFNRLVVAQDAAASNGDQNAFVVYNISPTDITLANTYQVPDNTWGVHAVGENLYAVVDNSDSVAFYQNFFANADGAITPTSYTQIEGIVRTHGLTYLSDEDLMILTDVGSGMVADDGAFVVVNDWFVASADGIVTMDEQIRVAGPNSLLGNPVDIALDNERNMIYVAERANGGGRVLGFDVPTVSGDAAPTYNEEFAGASAIHLAADMTPNFVVLLSKFFVSSNTQDIISGIAIYEDGTIGVDSFESAAADADGIFYNTDLDDLYQLNRTDNVINKYDDVLTNLFSGSDPVVTQTSTADFSNGREIAVSGDRLVVAQDASAANGMQNRLLVYDIGGTDITLSNTYDVDINLWGIQAVGEDLIAVIDNSDSVALFLDFFNNVDGLVDISAAIQVEGIVRTHGLTYDADSDLMILTDVGSGMVADDGAIVIVNDFLTNALDGVISMAEQTRIEGPSTLLGNPVDVALDIQDGLIYVAERANAGGRVLGFDMLTVGGDVAPTYDIPYPGVSAIHMTEINVLPNSPANATSPFANVVEAQAVAVKLSVYPNPASDNLNLVWEQSENAISTEVTINLVDLQGRVISSRQESVTTGQNTFQMEVAQLNNGLYTIVLANKDGVQTQRFLKK